MKHRKHKDRDLGTKNQDISACAGLNLTIIYFFKSPQSYRNAILIGWSAPLICNLSMVTVLHAQVVGCNVWICKLEEKKNLCMVTVKSVRELHLFPDNLDYEMFNSRPLKCFLPQTS